MPSTEEVSPRSLPQSPKETFNCYYGDDSSMERGNIYSTKNMRSLQQLVADQVQWQAEILQLNCQRMAAIEVVVFRFSFACHGNGSCLVCRGLCESLFQLEVCCRVY